MGATFGVIVCQQLDVELFSECSEVRRHHTAGGQIYLVTARLYLKHNRGNMQTNKLSFLTVGP